VPSKVPKHQVNARFWAQLTPNSRAFLQKFGIGGRDVGAEPSPSEAEAPAVQTSARARQLRELGGDDAGSRADRRRAAALEREASRRQQREQRIERRAAEQRQARKQYRAALRNMTPAERRVHFEAQKSARAERDRRYLERIRDRLAANYPDHELPEIAAIPREVWIMCRDCLADATGRAIRIWFARQRNKVAVGTIRIAALVPGPNGRTRYTWADARARAIAALGLALHELSTPTIRRGRWSRCVMGVTRGALCSLLSNPFEPSRRPHKNTLGGVHVRGATLESGQVGYLKALELSGFLYRQQLPAHQVHRFERWRVKRGDVEEVHASNRYWIVTDTPTAPQSDDCKRALIAAHHAGLEAHKDRPRREPRTAYEALALAAPARAAPS
jgi:hypothetical protein